MIPVSQLWQAFLTALSLLSIFPIPTGWLTSADNKQVQGYSLLFYPLVGLFVGLVIAAATFFFLVFGSMLTAALLVTVWVILTGALHLDGLADTADAWLGGHGDREKTLRILKDTHIGMAAVVAIVLILILKILAIDEIDESLVMALIAAPVISRSMVIVLLLTTPYVREDGIASLMTNAMPKLFAWSVVGLVVILSAVFLQWHAIFVLGSVLLSFFLYRFLIIRRLGGTTGDTAGAFIELSEIIILLDFAAIEFLT